MHFLQVVIGIYTRNTSILEADLETDLTFKEKNRIQQ